MRLIFSFLLVTAIALPSAAAQNKQRVELTEVDIARLNSFSGEEATVFGIGLWMTPAEVQRIVARQPALLLERDKTNKNRMYLYTRSDSGKVLLGYLKWVPKDSGLNQIVLYQSITPYLKGLTCTILSSACLDPQSEVYKSFLGQAADDDVVLDVPSLGLKTVRYYYPALALMIEVQQEKDEKKYSMILYGF